jgi:hypothetical protein
VCLAILPLIQRTLLPSLVTAEKVERRVALKRNAEVSANRIEVETHGREVALTGTIRSWLDRQRVAWSAPGVTKIAVCVAVAPTYFVVGEESKFSRGHEFCLREERHQDDGATKS